MAYCHAVGGQASLDKQTIVAQMPTTNSRPLSGQHRKNINIFTY